MVKSMTGFGREKYSTHGREYVVETKTVNHKYLDINIKLPRQYSVFEDCTRRIVSKEISRGKIEVNIQITEFENENKQVVFDEKLIKTYLAEAEMLEREMGIKNDLTFCRVLQLPEAFKLSTSENEEELLNELKIALNSSLDKLKNMRQEEGNNLAQDIKKKCEKLLILFNNVEDRANNVVVEYKEKLSNRISELLLDTDINPNDSRFATEVAFFADKACIDEEIVRFKSHVRQLQSTLELDEPIGKKLDFIVQEMNREVNTIGSKANDLTITQSVIELKNEMEKIREQIQNIE